MDCRRTVLSEIVKLSSQWCSRLGSDFVVPLEGVTKVSDSALLNQKNIENEPGKLPNTFIPGRNLLFLTYAAALCYERGIQTIVGGMCETDYSGYPDCRSETIESMQKSLSLGMETSFKIVTPLMHLTKSDTWKLAEKLGGTSFVDLIIENTATCYQGDRENRHEWGYGCNNCPACNLRRDGYLQYINTLN
jgi:7-cyano-7-deazaguanine synthase